MSDVERRGTLDPAQGACALRPAAGGRGARDAAIHGPARRSRTRPARQPVHVRVAWADGDRQARRPRVGPDGRRQPPHPREGAPARLPPGARTWQPSLPAFLSAFAFGRRQAPGPPAPSTERGGAPCAGGARARTGTPEGSIAVNNAPTDGWPNRVGRTRRSGGSGGARRGVGGTRRGANPAYRSEPRPAASLLWRSVLSESPTVLSRLSRMPGARPNAAATINPNG